MDEVTQENKENIIKMADDLMNFSLDSLNLGAGGNLTCDKSEQEEMPPAPVVDKKQDSEEEVANELKRDIAHMSFQTASFGQENSQDNNDNQDNDHQHHEIDQSEQQPQRLIEPKEQTHETTKTEEKEENTSFKRLEEEKQELEQETETELEPEAVTEIERQEQERHEEEMEFTKNYSDDLLMGQNDGQGQSTGGVDLADFELPPYSGSSSGSEPRQQSPSKRKSSSSSSSTAHQATSSQQQQPSSVGLRGLRDLLVTSYTNNKDVLQWKKPIETGIYFAMGVTLITAFTFFSIISVVAYSALGVIATSGLIRVYKSVMLTLNKSPETPFDHVWQKVLSLNVSISQDKVHEFIDRSLGNINSSLIYFKQVLLFEDKIATLKFGFYFYLLTYIGSWFNGMTLITLCYLAIFSLPIAYENNKAQVDQYFNMIHGHVCSTTSKVTSMIFGGAKDGSVTKKQK